MKHTSIPGTGFGARRMFVALLLLGMLATAGTFATPAIAQDDFPWATKVSVVVPTSKELKTILDSGGIRPEWVNQIYAKPWDKNNLAESDQNPYYKSQSCAIFLGINKRHPFFTPDGEWIQFDDHIGFAWMVPTEGGEPVLAYDWYMKGMRTSEGKIQGGTEGIWQTSGLSPDGKEVVSILRIADLQDGTKMVSDSHGGFSFSNYVISMKAGNIETGEERLLAKDAIQGRWSHNGNMFVYVKRDHNLWITGGSWDNFFAWEPMITGLYVKDLATGQEWKLADLAAYPCFSADDSAVICSMKDSNGLWQIFSIPLEGGAPKQITFYGPNDVGRNARITDASPDGQWILHTGDFWSEAKVKTGLCACNIVTGASYPLFPAATTMTTEGSFSPDGKKIVFVASAPYYENGAYYYDTYSLYTSDFNPTDFMKPTSVTDAAPVSFALTGNYPNPFNPTTTISFTLPSTGTANLAVYSITGQKVRDLVNGPMSAGAHSIVWDGRDASGQPVSSGVYLTRLSQGSHTTASRMLLAK